VSKISAERLEEVWKTPLFSHVYTKKDLLPRQAWDTYMEKLRQKEFSAGEAAE
jgi:hypothetical protein